MTEIGRATLPSPLDASASDPAGRSGGPKVPPPKHGAVRRSESRARAFRRGQAEQRGARWGTRRPARFHPGDPSRDLRAHDRTALLRSGRRRDPELDFHGARSSDRGPVRNPIGAQRIVRRRRYRLRRTDPMGELFLAAHDEIGLADRLRDLGRRLHRGPERGRLSHPHQRMRRKCPGFDLGLVRRAGDLQRYRPSDVHPERASGARSPTLRRRCPSRAVSTWSWLRKPPWLGRGEHSGSSATSTIPRSRDRSPCRPARRTRSLPDPPLGPRL